MRPSRIVVSVACLALAAVVLGLIPGSRAPAAQNAPIVLANWFMEWVDVNEEGALFRWSVDVTNNTSEPVRLQIIFDLLDDDDRAINRDEQNNPLNTTIVTVEPGARLPVEEQGIVDYDRAAEVVSYQASYRVIQ